jgi:hypothetical protein
MSPIPSVMNSPESSETSGSTKQKTQHRMPEDQKPPSQHPDKLSVNIFHAAVCVPRHMLGSFRVWSISSGLSQAFLQGVTV